MLKEEEQPMYHACKTAYTIKHVLTECIDQAPMREIFYNTSCMKELFKKKKKKKVDAIMSFQKSVGLYGKILRSDHSKYKHYQSI